MNSVLEEIAWRVREHPELGFGIVGYVGVKVEGAEPAQGVFETAP